MTIVLNLYGGPGTGKSTSAAYIFSRLKQQGINAELVREYVKDWAWESRKIGDFDQIYLLGKQMRKETILYDKVDVIVTDSPLYLAAFYADKFAPKLIAEATLESVTRVVRHAQNIGHEYIHYFLERTKTYNPAGRYQTEDEAKNLDADIMCFMVKHMGFAQRPNIVGTDLPELERVVTHLTSILNGTTSDEWQPAIL